MNVRAALFMVLAGMAAPAAHAAMLETYQRAAQFQDARRLVSKNEVSPNWIDGGDSFWYLQEHGGKKTFVLVNPKANHQGPAFDHARLAEGLSAAADEAFTPWNLPLSALEFRERGGAIVFRVKDASWHCELKTYRCEASSRPVGARAGELLAPDGKLAIFLRANNLWTRNVLLNVEEPLTTDGELDNDYASGSGTNATPVTSDLTGLAVEPQVYFSPDSNHVLSYRMDARFVHQQNLLEHRAAFRPRLHSYRYAVAGDEKVAVARMVLFDIRSRTPVPLSHPEFERVSINNSVVAWRADGKSVAFLQEDRGFRRARIQLATVSDGKVRTVVEESSDTYVNIGMQLRLLKNDQVLWSSERDGWNHLYRMDGRGHSAPQQLTRGQWVVREIAHVDERGGYVYFTAGGREGNQDPYYRHLYRVKLDGTGLRHLTPEAGDHTVKFSPTGRYFVDTYSRVDVPPVSVLRRADGSVVRQLQSADISGLQALGWRAPRPFEVKASDGEARVFGVMFLPSNFDAGKRYPVLDSVYPGPQSIRAPKSFDVSRYEDELAMAELGFIVVMMDGMGTPLRSKAFRDVSYRNMGAGGGLADHVAGIEQLAQRHPQMDLERVGIYGHSGGGYASARAMLLYPDFFKVAVSSAGNHEQRSYSASWGERFHHWPVNDENYQSQANAPLAGRLQGRLLLVHGDLDDNVHHTNTMQLADALIAENRNFDLLILPNRNHSLVNLGLGKSASPHADRYFLRRRWDYFVEHLQGVTPPKDFRIHDPGN